MDINRLSSDFAATGQVLESDLEQAVALGFRTIVDNRPDGEAPDQPGHAEIEAAARSFGLGFAYIPIVPGQSCDREAQELRKVLEAMEGPVLAYCRTGARSAALWRRYIELAGDPSQPGA